MDDGYNTGTATVQVQVHMKPIVSAGSRPVVILGTQSVEQDVDIEDLDTSPALLNLVLSAASNPALPMGNVKLQHISGTRWRATHELAKRDVAGEFTVTLSVTDEYGKGDSDVLGVKVVHPPTISVVPSLTIPLHESKKQSLDVEVGDEDTAAADLVTSVVSNSNEALVTSGSISVVGTGATRQLEFTPVTGSWGETEIRLSVTDGVGSAETVVKFIITAPPAFKPVPAVVRGINTPYIDVNVEASDPDSEHTSLSVTIVSTSDPLLCPLDSLDAGELTSASEAFSSMSHLYDEEVSVPHGILLAKAGSSAGVWRGKLNILPRKNDWGHCDIRLRVSDGTASDETVVSITWKAPPIVVRKRKHCSVSKEEVRRASRLVNKLHSSFLLTFPVAGGSCAWANASRDRCGQ